EPSQCPEGRGQATHSPAPQRAAADPAYRLATPGRGRLKTGQTSQKKHGAQGATSWALRKTLIIANLQVNRFELPGGLFGASSFRLLHTGAEAVVFHEQDDQHDGRQNDAAVFTGIVPVGPGESGGDQGAKHQEEAVFDQWHKGLLVREDSC